MASVLTDDVICNYLSKQNTLSVASFSEFLISAVTCLIISNSIYYHVENKSIYLLSYKCSV
jgi:hypothetical protein